MSPDLYPHHLDALEPEEIQESEWVTFTRRTKNPKLAWLEDCLGGCGIPSRRHGRSFYAPILQVARADLEEAWTFLTEADAVYGTVDDVPDDDPRYDIFRD